MKNGKSAERLRLVAHRGWSRRFPENSLVAMAAAIAAQADEVELDVWCSRDRVPFVCHDPTLDRVCDLTGRHDRFTMAELRRAQIRMPDGSLLPGIGIPSLEDALRFCARRIGLNLHVKDPGPDDAILRWLHEWFGGRRPPCGSYIAGEQTVLDAARRVCPEIPRCCLAGQSNGAVQVENARRFECERLQFWRGRYTPADVDQARGCGLITNLFWSDDAAEIASLWQTGILAPLTNDIGGVRPRLVELGLVE